MLILGMSPMRLAVSGLGAHYGAKIARDTVLPMLANSFPNVIKAPEAGKLGAYDFLVGVGAVLGAAGANKLLSGFQS